MKAQVDDLKKSNMALQDRFEVLKKSQGSPSHFNKNTKPFETLSKNNFPTPVKYFQALITCFADLGTCKSTCAGLIGIPEPCSTPSEFPHQLGGWVQTFRKTYGP